MVSQIIIAIIIIGGLLLASCGGEVTPPPASTPTTTPSVIGAGALYETNCAVCHGANRQGVAELGPALTPESLAALSDTEIKEVILNGKPNTSMTPWKAILSPQETDALLQFIKSTSP